MRRIVIAVFGLAAVVSALGIGACQLPELKERNRLDAGDMVAPIDAPDGPGDPDAADIDASVDATVPDDMIPPGAALGSCDAARWSVSASASDPSDLPAHAVDGLVPSRWSTGAAQSPGQYLQVDFGGYVLIRQVALDNLYEGDGAGDFPRGLDVLGSTDGAAFERTIKSEVFTGDTVATTFPAAAVRAVRLQLTQGAQPSWWTVHELRFGCSIPGVAADAGVDADTGPDAGIPATGVDPNRAHWTATASGSDGNAPPGNAVDGSVATRWASGKAPQRGDEWFRLDLGVAASIREVWLTAQGGDFPSAYALELSTDDVTYTQVALGLGGDVTRIAFPAQSARYLRIRQIGAGYNHWWSIHDVSIVSAP